MPTPLTVLEGRIRTQAFNALMQYGRGPRPFQSIDEVEDAPDGQLLRLSGMGRTGIAQIRKAIADYRLEQETATGVRFWDVLKRFWARRVA